jgi:hypothetical protein
VTEAEWLDCTDPEAMLLWLRDRAAEGGCFPCGCCRVRCRRRAARCPAYRKLRLFACACCRRAAHQLTDPVCQKALEALEQYIEGVIDEDSYLKTAAEFDTIRRDPSPKVAGPWTALYCALHPLWLGQVDEVFAERRWRMASAISGYAARATGEEEGVAQSALLRDIVGNPFRPAALDTAVLRWNGDTIPKMAAAIYEERSLPAGTFDNDRLAVLADALEEAGADAALADHLRAPGRAHVRGCFVVDLLLAKG